MNNRFGQYYAQQTEPKLKGQRSFSLRPFIAKLYRGNAWSELKFNDLGINDTQIKNAELKVTSPADGPISAN